MVVVRLPWQRYLPASEVLSGERLRAVSLGVGMPILLVPMATFIHWAVGVRVSPGNLDTVQVTMYGSPSCGVESLEGLMLVLIDCPGTA